MPPFAKHGVDIGAAFRRDNAMKQRSLANRVETLEKTVDDLRNVATQVGVIAARIEGFDVQFVQLRGEMRVEFSAVRQEMSAEFSAVRKEMSAEFSAVRNEMSAEFSAVRNEMSARLGKLSEEIRQGDEETRRFMRVLYEDLVARIAILGERPWPQ